MLETGSARCWRRRRCWPGGRRDGGRGSEKQKNVSEKLRENQRRRRHRDCITISSSSSSVNSSKTIMHLMTRLFAFRVSFSHSFLSPDFHPHFSLLVSGTLTLALTWPDVISSADDDGPETVSVQGVSQHPSVMQTRFAALHWAAVVEKKREKAGIFETKAYTLTCFLSNRDEQEPPASVQSPSARSPPLVTVMFAFTPMNVVHARKGKSRATAAMPGEEKPKERKKKEANAKATAASVVQSREGKGKVLSRQ